MNIIETKKLTKSYGTARGIVDLDLAVREGEIFGFIGPNGAGKSTTIRTLLGLIFKTSGSATIFGLDIERDKKEILAEVGYLPSEIFYYDNMRAIDLLKYSASFYKKDCTGRIVSLAETLDLDLNKKIRDMSLGNRKKVGIVQGLLHSPRLIILDEPTSGLDPLMQKKFFELILQENQRGATVLFSSHILSEVQKICHRVAIIKEGSILKIEEIGQMSQQRYQSVSFATAEPIGEFQLEGAQNIQSIEGGYSFMYRGDCNRLLAKLGEYPIHSLTIAEPSLEDIFMHYYD